MTALDTQAGRFPTRPRREATLTGQVIAWARANPDVTLTVPRTRHETYRTALMVGSRELSPRSEAWRAFGCQVVCEYHADITGEPLGGDTPVGQQRARKLLGRLVASYGALNALRLVAEALERGAGIGEGHEDDVLAVLKYAAAIGRGERAGWTP